MLLQKLLFKSLIVPRKMTRNELLNFIIFKKKYKTYLGIGVRNPEDNFDLIKIENKIGVDPAGNTDYNVTSDEFFSLVSNDTKYDIVFIDGLHLESQVDKDISNSLKHLSDNGTIVLHDCNPISKLHQTEEYTPGLTWNGTVWKSFLKLRINNPNLNMFVINCDHGIGIIQKGKQNVLNLISNPTYEEFDVNRKKFLNLISPFHFILKYKNYIGSAEKP